MSSPPPSKALEPVKDFYHKEGQYFAPPITKILKQIFAFDINGNNRDNNRDREFHLYRAILGERRKERQANAKKTCPIENALQNILHAENAVRSSLGLKTKEHTPINKQPETSDEHPPSLLKYLTARATGH